MSVGDPRRHLYIEGSQDPLVLASVRAYTYVLIGVDLLGRPVDTEPFLQEDLDGLLTGNVFSCRGTPW